MGNRAWEQYAVAAGRHLMAMDRLKERLSAITGFPPMPPVDLSDSECATWLGLIRASETAAKEHGDALEAYQRMSR